MRRSAGRQSLGPLRVKNDGVSGIQPPRSRLSSGSSRSSFGSRLSFGGRPSLQGSRKSSVSSKSTSGKAGSSLVPKGRSSGYGRSYGHHDGYLKDPRPVNDKGFKERSIHDLVKFLAEEGYSHPISPKLLQSPQAKDFIRIFEFMYSFVEPNYKVANKHEEEIPRVFKMLGYPFNISKSSMFTIGSPHTWPSLLATLTWLREQIQYSLSMDVDKVMFPPKVDEFDAVPESKMLFNYIAKTYGEYMAGADTFEALQEELARQIRQNGVAGDLEQLAAENRRLLQELQTLKEQPDRVNALRDTHCSLKQDEEKYNSYLTQLNSFKRQQEQSLKVLNEEHSAMVLEYEAILQERQKKQEIFETQELSQADVERINAGQQQLKRQIESVEREIENLDRQCWDAEMYIGKTQDRIENKCAEYNQLAQRLKVIPPTAENAQGLDFEMKVDFHSCASGGLDFVGTIKPALTWMKKRCNEQVHKAQEQKITEHESLEQIEEMEAEKREELKMQESKHKRLEDSIECKKEVMQRECQQSQDSIEALQVEISQLKMPPSMTVHEAQKALQENVKMHEYRKTERQKEEEKVNNFLIAATTLVVEHKTLIEEHIQNQAKKAEIDLAELKKASGLS